MTKRLSKMARGHDCSQERITQWLHTQYLPWTKKELLVAKVIFETKYPDARFEHLHPNRTVRLLRLLEARAVLKALKKVERK